MILNVNKTYRVKSDCYQYIIQKKSGKDKDGNQLWRNLGYYADLEKAVAGLADYRLKISKAEQIDEIAKTAKRIEKESKKIMNEIRGIPVKAKAKTTP